MSETLSQNGCSVAKYIVRHMYSTKPVLFLKNWTFIYMTVENKNKKSFSRIFLLLQKFREIAQLKEIGHCRVSTTWAKQIHELIFFFKPD